MKEDKKNISIVEVQLQNFLDARRPKDESIRNKFDIGYSWDGYTALLFEIRPQWNNPTNKLQHPFAKIRLIISSKIWKLYWMRSSGKWESYEPMPEALTLDELLQEISRDGYGCFFG